MSEYIIFPEIELSGTPYEIGFGHGSKGKKQVLASLSTYKAMFKDFSNIEWEDARKRGLTYIDAIRDYDPDLLDELKGVADGAGVDFEDILALNARSELVLQGASIQKMPTDGCTSIGISSELGEKGHVFLGQTWDWKPTQREAMLVLKIHQKDKPDILMITEGGIIGKIGFNSAGVGVCLNALSAAVDPIGVPLHIALRGALNSDMLSNAILAFGKHKLACCGNFLCVHDTGEVIDVEVGPDDFDVLYPEKGYFVHTNHFVSPRHITVFKDTTKINFPDTYVRRGRASKLVEKAGKGIGVDTYKEIFKDHIEYPDSICRHINPKSPIGKQMSTVFAIIMDMENKEMHVASGEPCSAPWTLYKM